MTSLLYFDISEHDMLFIYKPFLSNSVEKIAEGAIPSAILFFILLFYPLISFLKRENTAAVILPVKTELSRKLS